MSRRLVLLLAIVAGLAVVVVAVPRLAPPRPPEVTLVDVLAAAKELPQGTQFVKESLQGQVKRKQFRPEDVPANAIISEEDLFEKQLIKTLRLDDPIRRGDVVPYKPFLCSKCECPVFRFHVEEESPLLKQGSRIDIIGKGANRRQEKVQMMVLPDVLVDNEAVIQSRNHESRVPENRIVCVFINTEQALLLRMCQVSNLQFSYTLRTENSPPVDPKWSPDAVKTWLRENFAQSTP